MGVAANGRRTAPAQALIGLLVPVGLAGASAVLSWAAAAPIAVVRAPGPAPVDAVLALAAAVACAGVLAVCAVGATLSVIAVTSGQVTGRLGRLARRLTPRIVRAAVTLAVGATVIAGPAVAASSASLTPTVPSTASAATHGPPTASSPRPVLPPGWNPDRPAAPDPRPRTSAAPSVPIAAGTQPSAGVVVRRGDTLWAIAARHLGTGATDAQVAAEWPRWHATNRSTIGPDPGLIMPGQRLRVPQSHRPTGPAPVDRTPTTHEESR